MAVRRFFRRILSWRPLPLALIALVLVATPLAWKGITRGQAGGPPGVPVMTSNDPLLAVHMMMEPLSAAPLAASPETAPAQASGPRLELSSSFYDFGVLRSASAPVRRDFYIINHGSAPLVIRQAVTTCGCTTAELSAASAPPGTSIRTTVIFDPAYHDLSGQTVRRGLILLTNDPDHPEVAIWVQASLR